MVLPRDLIAVDIWPEIPKDYGNKGLKVIYTTTDSIYCLVAAHKRQRHCPTVVAGGIRDALLFPPREATADVRNMDVAEGGGSCLPDPDDMAAAEVPTLVVSRFCCACNQPSY